MEGSPQRHAIYKKHLEEKGITSGKTVLHSFSDTRWAARSGNLDGVINVYPVAKLTKNRWSCPKGVWGLRPQKNRVKPRPRDPRKRGERPSGYVEIKIAVKHFLLPHFGKKGMKVLMLQESITKILSKISSI